MSKWEDKYEKLKNGEFDARIDELKEKKAIKLQQGKNIRNMKNYQKQRTTWEK